MSVGSTRDRLRGAMQCASDHHGQGPADYILHGEYRLETGHEVVKNVLQKGSLQFSAIFTLNDIMAIGAMKALSEMDWKVPGRLFRARLRQHLSRRPGETGADERGQPYRQAWHPILQVDRRTQEQAPFRKESSCSSLSSSFGNPAAHHPVTRRR